MLRPCFLAVETTDLRRAKIRAPARVRNEPEIFILTFIILRSCSARLLVKGTSKSVRKRRVSGSKVFSLCRRLWPGRCLMRPRGLAWTAAGGRGRPPGALCRPGWQILGDRAALFVDAIDEQRGLGVRVTAGGGKSFLVQYRHAGEKRRMPLGSCAAVSLAKARLAARQIVGAGKDPAGERKAAALEAKREALTLAALIEQWEALHLAGKRPNYSAAAVSALRRSFAKHLNA